MTARKRAERLRDVPASVVAISGRQLAAANITQVVDLSERIPSLQITYAAVQPFVSVRGFGSGNNVSFEQSVGKFVDNVSFGRDQDARLPLFDIQQVEVLKGPQVLLYGNSTTAGALNISTRKPGPDFEADGTASYEFLQHEYVLQGGTTIPLNSWSSLRLSGIYDSLDKGQFLNLSNGKYEPTFKNYAGRAELRLDPTPDLSIFAKAEYDNAYDRGEIGLPLAQPVSGPFQFLSVGRKDQVYFLNNSKLPPFFQDNFNAVDNKTFEVDVKYQVGGGTLSSTTAYRVLTVGENLAGPQQVPIFSGAIFYKDKQFSQELRYNRTFGRLDLTGGGYFQYNDRTNIETALFNFAPLPFPPFALDFSNPAKLNSYSVFVDGTYHLTDNLSFEAGGRYSILNEHADQAAVPGDIVPHLQFGDIYRAISPNPALNGLYSALFDAPPHSFKGLHFQENHFQPQGVIQYKLSPDDQVYGKIVHGAKAGGFDVVYQGSGGTVLPADAHFAPETATSYEVGYKGLALDRRLGFALSAFRTNFTNLQTNAYVGTATVASVTNVGKARTQGFEAEATYSPLPDLHISLAGTYTDAEYLDFPGGAATRAGTALGQVTQDLSHTATPLSSRFSGTVGADYEREIGKYTLRGGPLLVGRSSYNASFNNEPILRQQGYVQVDVHLELAPQNGGWTVSLFGKDLNNVRYLTYGSVAPGTNGGIEGFVSRGAEVGLQAGFKM